MGEDDEPVSLTVKVKGGDRLYISGYATITEGWLERRRWWQFWMPRYVEKFVTYDKLPDGTIRYR